jgi:hypothetical protein
MRERYSREKRIRKRGEDLERGLFWGGNWGKSKARKKI